MISIIYGQEYGQYGKKMTIFILLKSLTNLIKYTYRKLCTIYYNPIYKTSIGNIRYNDEMG